MSRKKKMVAENQLISTVPPPHLVHEDVLARIIQDDESEALLDVEPFDGAHDNLLPALLTAHHCHLRHAAAGRWPEHAAEGMQRADRRAPLHQRPRGCDT